MWRLFGFVDRVLLGKVMVKTFWRAEKLLAVEFSAGRYLRRNDIFMGKSLFIAVCCEVFLRGFFGVLKNFYGGLLLGHDDQELLAGDGFDFDFEVLVEEGFDGVFELGGDGHVEAIVLVASLCGAIRVSTRSAINLNQQPLPRQDSP